MKRYSVIAAILLASNSLYAEPLLPTVEGTTWEYKSIEELVGEGSAPVQSIVSVRTSSGLLNGKQTLKWETFVNDVLSKTEFVSVGDDGVVCHARTGKDGKMKTLSPPQTIVPAVLKTGAAWDFDDEVAGIKMHQHFTVAGEENITIPAGRFRAFHFHAEESSLMSVSLDRWFVRGTGFVKEITNVRGPTGALVQRLSAELTRQPAVFSKPSTTPTASAAPASPKQPDSVTKVEEKAASMPKRLVVEVSSEPSGERKTEFKSDVPNIYVRWQGHDLPQGAKIRVVWVAEDVGDLVEPNFVVDETETTAPAPDAGARFTLARPPDGWAEGKYRLEFYVDDVLEDTLKVTITK